MKKVILGFVMGIVTSMAFTVFATNTDIFQAQKATFDVVVNGEEFKSQNPTIVVDGRTYLPLKETGDVLGINVQWNGVLRRVEIEKEQQEQKEIEAEAKSEVLKQTDTPQEKGEGKVFKEVEIVPGELEIYEIDGEQYIPPSAFGYEYIKREGDNWYIAIPGEEPVLVKKGDEPTENSIKYRSRIIIKLSSLGLKAEPQGDMIIIKYK